MHLNAKIVSSAIDIWKHYDGLLTILNPSELNNMRTKASHFAQTFNIVAEWSNLYKNGITNKAEDYTNQPCTQEPVLLINKYDLDFCGVIGLISLSNSTQLKFKRTKPSSCEVKTLASNECQKSIHLCDICTVLHSGTKKFQF